jgi:nucleotide-binding universal stress UspA family protein
MRKILVALDGSECAFRAVEYCGLQFAGLGDLHVTLFHVLPYMPARIWDVGHILSPEEKTVQANLISKWLDNQKRTAEPIFRKAMAMLEKAGIEGQRVETKIVSDSIDVAGSILEEARDGGYLSLVLGRCGAPGVREFFLGSTTNKIINHGAGLTICVVE